MTASFRVGDLVAGKYRLLRESSRSGDLGGVSSAAQVFDAEHAWTGKRFTLKVLGAHAGENLEMRFLREARAASALVHAHVVKVYDVDRDETGLPYYTMKFHRGESAGDVLERLRALEPEAVRRYTFSRRLDIFAGVLRALAHAHAQGVVHRDVKPDNVLVGAEGEVTLADWGIAAEADEQADGKVTGIAGTPGYMSPEQARGEAGALGPRSDLYSAFAMLYELLTLAPLVEPTGTVLEVLQRNQEVEAPSIGGAAYGDAPLGPVPAEYRHYLKRGLARDPAHRYPTAEAALLELERVRSGEFAVECPITFLKRGERAMNHSIERGGAVPVIVSLVVVLAVIAGVVYAIVR